MGAVHLLCHVHRHLPVWLVVLANHASVSARSDERRRKGRRCICRRSMINELTHKDGERVALNSFRYALTVVSNIFIYTMASVLFSTHSSGEETDITPADAHIFQTLTFIVVGIGLICMIIFHLGLKESTELAEESEYRLQLSLTTSGRLRRMTWKSFLREKEFYQCAFIWMCSRVILNVTQVR